MNIVGTGGEDWVDLDLDIVERHERDRLRSLLVDDRAGVAAAINADYEVEIDRGIVFLVVGGRRRYRAQVGNDDRLILTGILDPNGPL